jgi:3-deoxy-D-manno-octulosonic-acid transferase
VFAQTQDDAVRLGVLGAPVKGVFGNLKFDAKPDATQVALGQSWRLKANLPVLMLASSREGEEGLWLDAWQKFTSKHPAVRVHWLIVPRHPQRVIEVENLLQSGGLKVSRRTTWGQEGPFLEVDLKKDSTQNLPLILLGDSLGEMALYYSCSDVALLGGSFEKLGGQNLIESAANACPIVMGPHTFNFSEASHAAEAAGAAQRSQDMEDAVRLALDTVQSKQLQADKSIQAAQFARQHGGATQRTVQAVQALLSAIQN